MLKDEKKTLQKLDKYFENKMSSLTIPKFFYQAKGHEQLIANTFDINIKNETKENAKALLKNPILKKNNIGTQKGLKLALSNIYGDIEIIKTKPFCFKVKTKAQGTSVIDIKRAKELININKPCRDIFEYVEIDMPKLSLKTKSGILMQIKYKF